MEPARENGGKFYCARCDVLQVLLSNFFPQGKAFERHSSLHEVLVLFYVLAAAGNTPPVISGPTALSLVVGTPSSYVFNVTDDSGMPRVDYTASGDVTVGYSRAAYTHNITITVNSQMSSSISLLITANDSLGAVAMQQPLVIFCPCLNSQPCLPIAVGEDGGTTRSIRATCNCNQGEIFKLPVYLHGYGQ